MAKEEANESYNMNKYTNNNINNHIEDEEDNNTNLNHSKSQTWSTWEELLLACAVKRHGFSNWDSVATEIRSRICATVFVSANNCEIKYRDLKRRFHVTTEEEEGSEIPLFEKLRSLRVEELRLEVQRRDVSILSLELKVKKLEEEREEKPDLEDKRKKKERFENTSMNESNSTSSGEKTTRNDGDEPSQTRDDSDDNNLILDLKASQSGELGESGTSRRKRRKHSDGGEIRSAASKSQSLIDLLDRIRSHPRGSLFERRLRSQETQDYKSMVKQHLGFETIQRKLKQGSYDSSSVSFYRDLQLLFTNAIVFFPPSSSESMAAHELRTVVYEEMRKETGKSSPKLINWHSSKEDYDTSDSSMATPLIVCKKRKLVSPLSSSFSQKEEIKEETVSEEIVTCVRSSRRANKGNNKQKESKTNSSNQTNKTTEKKMVSSSKKKSVNEFLKRLKNSPQKEGNKSKKESKAKPRELRSNSEGKKVEKTPMKRAPGRPQKKTEEARATAPTSSASGKRGKGKQKQGKGQ